MLNPGAAAKRKDSNDSINFRETGNGSSFINPIAVDSFGEFDPNQKDAANAFLDDEEKEAEEARRFQEDKKRQNESPYKECYRDTTGNYYDPAKKFGIIQDNSLLYDNVTTSYPLNLPTDYYLKYIQSTLP